VAAYSAVPPDDPFAISKAMFTALAAELSGPAAAGLTACELEDLLDERGREVIRQLLQDHYDLRTAREEQQAREQRAPATGPDGITRTRLETGHGRLLATLFGTVRVTRCAWRKPGAGNWCPAGAALSLPAGRHSHSLAKLAALEAARGSSGAAHAAIARRCGPVIGKRQLEQAVTAAAADIPAFYAARVPEPCTPPALVVLSADCKGIVMRPGALRAATAKAAARLGKMRTRLACGEKPNHKRMAALVTVYDAEPAKRRPHHVIAPPGGRNGTRPLRPGPKTLAKWLAGSVRKDPAEVIAAAFDEAGARDPGHLRTWRRSRPHPPRSDQQRRLRTVLELPPRPRTPAPLPRHQAREIRTRRLSGYLTPKELHPKPIAYRRTRKCPRCSDRERGNSVRGGRLRAASAVSW
jgi:hypothetical protein